VGKCFALQRLAVILPVVWIRRMPRRWETWNGLQEAVYYSVVESYRDEAGRPRHRTILALGTHPTPSAWARALREEARVVRARAEWWASRAADYAERGAVVSARHNEVEARELREEAADIEATAESLQGLQRQLDVRPRRAAAAGGQGRRRSSAPPGLRG
jgi:hypothetical protein